MANRVKFTAQKKEKFLKELRFMPNIQRAADSVAISRQTVFDHRNDDPEFAAQVEEAIEAGLDRMEKIAWERATRRAKPSDTLLIFMLKGYRKQFSDRIQLTDADGKNAFDGLARALAEAVKQ